MAEDYYKILGLDKSATKDDIKRAYRKLAHKHHPDKDGGDGEMFKKVNEAHEVLSDDKKRSQYDQFGQVYNGGNSNPYGDSGFDFSGFSGGFSSGGFSGGGFSDIFEEFFNADGGGQHRSRKSSNRGNDIEIHLSLDFLESCFGVEKELNLNTLIVCPDCDGKGVEKGYRVVKCEDCQGQGSVKRVQRTILGNIVTTSVCSKCNGTGEVPEVACKKCHGQGRVRDSKNFKVQIPAGVDNGSTVRVPKKGEAGLKGGENGDLYIHIIVKDHATFKRNGYDIRSDLKISIAQAVLGDEVSIETIDGNSILKIPAGILSGQVLRLSEKGVEMIGKGKRGDQLIKIIIDIPKNPSSAELDIFEQLAKLTNKDIKPQKKSGVFW